MLIFPPTMVDGDADRPVIVFKVISKNEAKNDTHIIFPIPQALQFSDSAAYGNSELGFTGAMILNAGKSSGVSDAFNNVVNQAQASVPADLKSLAGMLGSNVLRGENRSAVGVATGTTLNKNIVTEFSGVGTRQFSFQFKLISGSARESRVIRDIVDTFRNGLYPEGNSLQLKYPPTWTINFMKGGKEIDYIPKIFETYLTTMSSSYNNSMNLFHEDGSPVEVDIQITFMESRVLTLADIKALQKDPYKESDFFRAFHRAKEIADEAKKIETKK